jgi:hypothetical protein
MKGVYVALGSVMLTISAIMIMTVSNQVPQLFTSLTQAARIGSASQNQITQLVLLGQKLMPIFTIAGAVCLGYGIRAKRENQTK